MDPLSSLAGFANGGYVNRNYPNVDPQFEGGAAVCTYEFFPPKTQDPQPFNFLVGTSGLNAFPHAFLMPSGKLFVQANLSTGILVLFLHMHILF